MHPRRAVAARPRFRLAALAVAVALVAAPACGGDGPSFCDVALEFERADLRAGGDLEGRMSEALAVLGELVDLAPDEIRRDVETVRAGVDEFVTEGRPPGADFRQASARVSEYLATECE